MNNSNNSNSFEAFTIFLGEQSNKRGFNEVTTRFFRPLSALPTFLSSQLSLSLCLVNRQIFILYRYSRRRKKREKKKK